MLNHRDDDVVAITTPLPELPCMGVGGTEDCCSSFRNRQYNFTVNLRATATMATSLPRRKLRRLKKRCNSGSLREATQAASTNSQRIMRLP